MVESKTTGPEQVDVTGLMYVHTETGKSPHGLYNGKTRKKLLKKYIIF
jgi:hypothetical protein